MTTLSRSARQAIAAAMGEAAHGEGKQTAARLAKLYKVSVSTIYRHAGLRGSPRPRAAKRPEYREWVRLAVQIAHQAPEPVPLDLAIQAGIDDGLLPLAAGDMPLSTARGLRKGLQLVPKPKRTHRMHADYPMQAVQIDGSSSEHLVVAKALPNGDYLLKLHRRPAPQRAGGYKNKPLGKDRMRVLIYALWDMCTGYTRARYCVARGENALDEMDFLCWALADTGDPRRPLNGVPDDLWLDQGVSFRSAPAKDLTERLDINLATGEAYAKERMGGVERSHRTRWLRFERALFLRSDNVIRLSELNARLTEYEIEENARRPSRTPVAGKPASRTAAWIALTNGRPADNPLHNLPENPIETMAKEARRKVDNNGIIRWGGVEYECERLHSCWVIARRGMDGTGNLIVEDERGDKHIAQPYQPRRYGEVCGVPATALDKLRDTPLAFSGADVYAPGEIDISNVSAMPARAAPAAALANPLDGDHYDNINQAMRAFCEIYPRPLSGANRALVLEQIVQAGLRKSAVRELAQGLVGLQAQAVRGRKI